MMKKILSKIKNPTKKGFTLIEVLVIVAIVALLMIALLLSMRKQRSKAEDAQILDDLHRLKIAFEEYYNDNNCYPPAEWFDGPEDCGSSNLQPYMREIPCNRKTDLPYHLEYDQSACGWFKIYANLQYPDGSLCSQDGSGNPDYNHGVSSTNVNVEVSCVSPTPSASPTPTPSVTPSPSPSPSPSPEGEYYCAAINNCQQYNTEVWTCTPNYFDSNCNGECAVRTGSCIHD